MLTEEQLNAIRTVAEADAQLLIRRNMRAGSRGLHFSPRVAEEEIHQLYTKRYELRNNEKSGNVAPQED